MSGNADARVRRIAPAEGRAGRASAHPGLEIRTSHQQIFDLYLPRQIYHHPATRRLLDELRCLTEGATVYRAVEGSWYEEIESVHVLRLAITTIDAKGARLWEIEEIRDAVRQVVAHFMVELHDSGEGVEEAVFFNDWTARGTLISR